MEQHQAPDGGGARPVQEDEWTKAMQTASFRWTDPKSPLSRDDVPSSRRTEYQGEFWSLVREFKTLIERSPAPERDLGRIDRLIERTTGDSAVKDRRITTALLLGASAHLGEREVEKASTAFATALQDELVKGRGAALEGKLAEGEKRLARWSSLGSKELQELRGIVKSVDDDAKELVRQVEKLKTSTMKGLETAHQGVPDRVSALTRDSLRDIREEMTRQLKRQWSKLEESVDRSLGEATGRALTNVERFVANFEKTSKAR